MEKVIVSKQFSLKLRDYIKGFMMAIGTPVLYFIQEAIPGYNLDPIVKIAISAGITYLLKNFFDKPKTIVVSNSNADAETMKKNLE